MNSKQLSFEIPEIVNPSGVDGRPHPRPINCTAGGISSWSRGFSDSNREPEDSPGSAGSRASFPTPATDPNLSLS
ncbi:MAG: hypothetical protein QF614_00360 [SAR324 cluster bacterium]|nr:hypothetical protein [SAR324 cluster bacterium]